MPNEDKKKATFFKIIAEIRELGDRGSRAAGSPNREAGLNTNYERLNSYLNDYSDFVKTEPDDALFNDFIEFLNDGPQLLLGTFVFIDPNQVKKQDGHDQNQMPFFLWGEEFFEGKEKTIKPSFQIPTLLALKDNLSKSVHFRPVNPSFKRLILSVNEFYRHHQPFHRQDFIRLFENAHLAKHKRSKRENELGILYVPSGEIDHCIFQLLAFHLASSKPGAAEISLDEEYHIDLCQLTVGEKLLEFWDKHEGSTEYRRELSRIFLRERSSEVGNPGCLKLIGKDSANQSLRSWLRDWGYLDGDLPTEKLIGCLEYLYFLLLPPPDNDNRFHSSVKYLDLVDESNGSVIGPRYLEGMEDDEHVRAFRQNIVPFIENRLTGLKSGESIARYDWSIILTSYFGILRNWVAREVPRTGSDGAKISKVQAWTDRVRVRVFVHFLNRCVHGYFESEAIERTCRGVIFYPILKMPSALQTEGDATNKYAGFFLCNLKDSNDKGLHFFNWRTEWTGASDEMESIKVPETNDFYWATIPQLQILANVLGKIETEEVFFNGILSKIIKEQEKHAALANIS
ncbi:MAG TPA: hypothetical protein VGO47_09300, partial [Chlamydiales bacterium]|nr:hypothetical protein [Chlamydiales bacterium]